MSVKCFLTSTNSLQNAITSGDKMTSPAVAWPSQRNAWCKGGPVATYSTRAILPQWRIVALPYPRLDDLNIIGFVDGCKVAIKTPSSVVDATATYNGWLHGHFRSNVLAFDAWGPLHLPAWVGLVVVGVAFHFASKQAAALDEVFWGIRTTFT